MSVAVEPDSFTVEITEDPHAFLAAAEEHLALDPVITTVVSSVTHRALATVAAGVAPPEHPRWWAVVRDGAGVLAGAAMRTAPFLPYPLFVLPMPEGAARALARAAHARGEVVGGANGALPAAQVFADEIADAHRRRRLRPRAPAPVRAGRPGRAAPGARPAAVGDPGRRRSRAGLVRGVRDRRGRAGGPDRGGPCDGALHPGGHGRADRRRAGCGCGRTRPGRSCT